MKYRSSKRHSTWLITTGLIKISAAGFLGNIPPNVTFLWPRDGFIDNEDLHDMLASLGKVSNIDAWKCFNNSESERSNCFRTQQTNTWMQWWVRHQARSTSQCFSPSLEKDFRFALLLCNKLFLVSIVDGLHLVSTLIRERILRRRSRMLLAALTRRMWD